MQQVHLHTNNWGYSAQPHHRQGDSFSPDQYPLPPGHTLSQHLVPHPYELPLANAFFDPSNLNTHPPLYADDTLGSLPPHDGAPFFYPDPTSNPLLGYNQHIAPQQTQFFPSSRGSTHPGVLQIPYDASSFAAQPPHLHHYLSPTDTYNFDQFGNPQDSGSIPHLGMDPQYCASPSSFHPDPSSQPLHHPVPVHSTALPHRPAPATSNGPRSLTKEEMEMAYERAREDDERRGRFTGQDPGQLERTRQLAVVQRKGKQDFSAQKKAEFDHIWGRGDGFYHEKPGRHYVVRR
ncbi:hypothetical protein JCM5353_009049 [Sporobolomyces roseus]